MICQIGRPFWNELATMKLMAALTHYNQFQLNRINSYVPGFFSLKGLILFTTTVTNNNNPKKEIQKKQGKQGLGPSCGSPGKESRLFWSESSWRNTRSHGIRLSLQTAGKTNPAWADTHTHTHWDTHTESDARWHTYCTQRTKAVNMLYTHTHKTLVTAHQSVCKNHVSTTHTVWKSFQKGRKW